MEALLKTLIPILISIESNGNIKAIGDYGAAIGCLQIHEIMVDDVNRILGARYYKYSDRTIMKKSKEMARVYFTHYIKLDESLSRIDQLVFIARSWVGGPKGPYKKSTIPYGEKVRKKIKR